MSRVCSVCGKKKVVGGRIIHKGLAKKKGGIGLHVVKNNKREFRPNIQSAKIREPNGTVRTVKVCAACIRSGLIAKA